MPNTNSQIYLLTYFIMCHSQSPWQQKKHHEKFDASPYFSSVSCSSEIAENFVDASKGSYKNVNFWIKAIKTPISSLIHYILRSQWQRNKHISPKNYRKLITIKTTTTLRPITLQRSCQVPESFCYGTELCSISCKKKTGTRLTDTSASFLYKTTCTTFLSMCCQH